MLEFIKAWFIELLQFNRNEVSSSAYTEVPFIDVERIKSCHNAKFASITLNVGFENIEKYSQVIRKAIRYLDDDRRVYAQDYCLNYKYVKISQFFTDNKGCYIDEVTALNDLVADIVLLIQFHEEISNALDNNPLNQHNHMALLPLVQNAVHLTHQLKQLCENI
jgi:hypothetical protein